MYSGAMHRSIRWEQEFFSLLPKSIISEISDINIPISNIVPPMLRKNNSLDRHSRTKIVIKRKETGIPLVKAESDVAVNVLQISPKSKIKTEVVSQIGFES